jgi:hypothetical protein
MAKYKIGDKVTMECVESPHIFSISEITEITCSAGTQTMYTGRLQGISRESGMIWTNAGLEKRIHEHEITGIAAYKTFFEACHEIRLKVEQRKLEEKQKEKE